MSNFPSIHTLVTHVNPDLDAIMGVFLLREFGESLIPNVRNLPIKFISAGKLPENKTAKQLEEEGFLCVDVGGGRFDNHPTTDKLNNNKIDLSAVELIARKLKIKDLEWGEFIEYARLQDTKGHHLYSTIANHHNFSLLSIINGIRILYPGDDQTKVDLVTQLLRVLPHYLPVRNKKKTFSEEILPLAEEYVKQHALDSDHALPHQKVLFDWIELLRNDDPSAFSRNTLDDLVTIKAILVGAQKAPDLTITDRQRIADICFDAILMREQKWYLAKKNFPNHGKVYHVGKYEVMVLDSDNGLMIKASRFLHKPDILLYRNSSTGAISFLHGKKGLLPSNFNRKLAAKIRIAEALAANKSLPDKEYDRVGSIEAWFLHQSLAMLVRGSTKSTDFEPTLLSFSLIVNILLLQVALYENSTHLHEKYKENVPDLLLIAFMKFDLRKFKI